MSISSSRASVEHATVLKPPLLLSDVEVAANDGGSEQVDALFERQTMYVAFSILPVRYVQMYPGVASICGYYPYLELFTH